MRRLVSIVSGSYGALRRLVHFALAFLFVAAAPALAQQKLVVAFGDSLSAGYRLGPTEGFAPRLEAALRRSGVPARVHNAGVSGDTSAAGRARLGWVLQSLRQKPDLVILELGANDMLRGLPPAQTRANLDAILVELKRRGIPVLLAGMRAAPNLGPGYRRQFDAIYPDLARIHGTPLYPLFINGIVGQRALLLDDGMHPNPKGVDRIVAGILPLVRQSLQHR